jgi:TRAP-type mannitol/chloroaromatic compound transport system permease large subunit
VLRPRGILTVIVLAVIPFGIPTASESATIGAAGSFILHPGRGTRFIINGCFSLLL